MSYWHRFCICPYYTYDEKQSIHCEAGKLRFKDKPSTTEYLDTYCCSYNYNACSLARYLDNYYKRKYEEDKETEEN